MKILKHYIAFKRGNKNFVCVEMHNRSNKLLISLKVDMSNVKLETGFSRNVQGIGHLGTGNLQVTINTDQDLDKAMPFIIASYKANQ